MRIVKTAAAMQRLARQWQTRGTRVGFVPTLGYLHAGHMSLVARARRAVGPRGLVVVSIYVNPTQFAPTEDLSRYPRDFPRDRQLCRQAGVDVIFAPADGEMYPGPLSANHSAIAPSVKEDGSTYSTYVVEETLSRGMEGASRPTHFRGVTTIVAKLFNLVQPRVSVFGAKDWQQAAVIQRMVRRDLNIPVKIIVAPTHREPDGLAMSSRNKYLNEAQRQQAVILNRAIKQASATIKQANGKISAPQLKQQLARFIATQPEARLDYLELFNPQTLQPVPTAEKGTHLALAIFFGKTRLIDNGTL